MLKARVIPVLLLHDGGLVKTTNFEKPVYVGDPINAVRIFNLKEVNELIFLDIDASKDGREPNYALIEDIAKEAFMPFGYGGGVNKISQIRQLLRLGVEKVIINTALADENFIFQAVDTFGSSTIVASVDLYHQKVFSHVTKRTDNIISFTDHVKKMEKLGVGEIMVNIVERDGTYLGYDIDSLKKISESVSLPVVGCGGAKGLEDLKMLISETECTGAAAGSMFVFYGKHNAVLITYPNENELKELSK